MVLHHLRILVVGRIWEPGMGLCAYEYHPGSYISQPAIEVDEAFLTREVISAWLNKNAGDFQSIEDFSVVHWHGDPILPWEKQANGELFDACMGF